MTICRPLLLCLALTACGGSDNDTPPEPTPVPGATMSLSSTTVRTIAGGTAIPINATLSSGGAIRWQLAPGTPGSLSANNGAAVRYLPPTGTLTAPAIVTVTASGDGASATLKLAVTPDPGPAGLTVVAGDGRWLTRDGIGATASFASATNLAQDGAGNIYVMDNSYTPVGTYQPLRLRKIGPNGTVTTLAGSVNGMDNWFGQPDIGGTARRLDAARGFAADAAGNLYVSTGNGWGHTRENPDGDAAVFKITPTGAVTVLAGTEEPSLSPALVDGTGSAARFLFPTLVGIDFSDNLFLNDNNPGLATGGQRVVTPRRITPAGVVTSLTALPRNLNADMNGNTYHYEPATRSILRTTPDGILSKEADAPFCGDLTGSFTQEYVSNFCVKDIIPAGGASYLIISGYRVVRMVVRH